ncbi:hypothetical protein ACIPYU_14010, partial [Paenarthrobacter nicotinovorans]
MRASPVLGPPTAGSAGSLSADHPDGARILPRIADTDANSVARGGSAPEVGGFLDDAVEALAGLRGAAAADARLFGFVEAADFAGRVEEISRVLEYVQIIAAQAVERTRNQARLQVQGSGGPEWRTGRTEPAANGGATGAGAGTGADSAGASAGSVLDDGYRNAAEFLRARLRIGIGEARRRLALSADALPGEGIGRATGPGTARTPRPSPRNSPHTLPVRHDHRHRPGQDPTPHRPGHHHPDGTRP